MIDKIHYIYRELITLSKKKTNLLKYVHTIHKFLAAELNVRESIFVFVINGYFFKSTYSIENDEYWDVRTNEAQDEERFLRLADIVFQEINFNKDSDIRVEIRDDDATTGYIIVRPFKENEGLIEIMEEIKDFFFLICRSIYRQYQLNERVKELSCLQNISKIAEKVDISIEEFLDEIVNILPPAWQYPSQAQARILFNDESFMTKNYKESERSLKAPIVLGKAKVGFVEVNYPQESTFPDAHTFLIEETHLIHIIAQELSITLEKKKAESESRQLEKQLRHADRLATLGQLSAGIAHEINEPLAGILGLAQLMEKNESLDEQAQSDLENIVSASLHARDVVKKLMLFARQMPSSQSDLNLSEAVNNAVFFLESRCRKNMVKIMLDLKDGMPSIKADSSQIHQVLINLIVNALQAMPEGGTITIRTFYDDTHVSLECSDTGIGMSKKVLSQIFNPFFTTKKINEGTGLGLSVVHGIIYSHGGEIKVKSKPGNGTRFTITFPYSLEVGTDEK
ncbi:MAG: PAS domain-containing sensor histidine kinase [Candidatus Cloacimonetes bacterium]|nr:PAS domain-containing sensor histidine kinase [Candidatus Cloacimonadota bacterium]